MKKTSAEWMKTEKYRSLVIFDPDGWDRRNFERSWNEEITEEEFERRVCLSTTVFKSL